MKILRNGLWMGAPLRKIICEKPLRKFQYLITKGIMTLKSGFFYVHTIWRK